jgi:hypothetical protein
MLATTPLKSCFPDFNGESSNVTECIEFVRDKFLSKVEPDNRSRVTIFEISARFRKDVQQTWQELSQKLFVQWKQLNGK